MKKLNYFAIAAGIFVLAGVMIGTNCGKFGFQSNSNDQGSLNLPPSGVATALQLYAAMTTVPTKACNGPFTLALLNAQGTAAISTQDLAVQFSTGASTNLIFYQDSKCSQNASRQLVIPAGSVQSGFYVVDGAIETVQVTAQSTGLTAASMQLTFTSSQSSSPIQHVIVIMQENRSFDHYFGTYPNAEGLPVDANGKLTTCLPQPSPTPGGTPAPCVPPFHDRSDYNDGSGHTNGDALTVLDNYKMDGFVMDQVADAKNAGKTCKDKTNPKCTQGSQNFDVMGYHNRDEIPNYWAYADHFVLQDHLFEPALSWSLVSHLYLVSGWSASCTSLDPMSCSTYLGAFDNVTNGMLSSSPAHIALVWNGSAPTGSYNIKRSTKPGMETTIQNVTNTSQFIDYRVADGTRYYYVVSYVDASGVESANSPEVGILPQGIPYSAVHTTPDPITIAPTSGIVTLTFNQIQAASYNIKRGTAPGTEVTIANVPKVAGQSTLTYQDTTVKNGNEYYYQVTAVVGANESPPSLEVFAVPGALTGNTPSAIAATSTVLQSANAWTDLSYLLDMNGVTWKYYLGVGDEPDCDDDQMTCPPVAQKPSVPSYWNPMGYFTSVAQKSAGDNSYLPNHVVATDQFITDVRNGTLPAVSWIIPNSYLSEHPIAGIQEGMQYVTSLVNAIMETGQPGYKGVNYWNNTVIFISWDDWGGFYDHYPPPIADKLPDGVTVIGYGIRVPGLIISPFVKHGIDKQVTSFDSYSRFIEDTFLNRQRLDPRTDGRPDSRPSARDGLSYVTDPISGGQVPAGDLMNNFDFSQAPIPPLIQTTQIPVDFVSNSKNQPPGGAVLLQWSPVIINNQGLHATYNLRRTTTSGSNYQLVNACSSAQAGGGSALATCTGGGPPGVCCSDATVTSGTTYYYVVTSVNSAGVETPNSTEVGVIAP